MYKRNPPVELLRDSPQLAKEWGKEVHELLHFFVDCQADSTNSLPIKPISVKYLTFDKYRVIIVFIVKWQIKQIRQGNKNMNKELDKYKVDHLILLVGGNLLPNAVAGRLLVKSGGKITLVHSAETAPTAQRLDNWLKKKDSQLTVHYKQIEESNPTNVIQSFQALLKKETGTIGLHYTGGTKAVAVHAHRVIRECGKEVVLSYLDARKLQLVIDAKSPETGQKPEMVYVGQAVSLSIEDVLFLADSKLVATKGMEMPALATAMLNSENHADFQTWQNDSVLSNRKNERVWKKFSEISVDLPQSAEIKAAIMADLENDGEKIVFYDTKFASYETGRGDNLVFSPDKMPYRKVLDLLVSDKYLAEAVFTVLQHIKSACDLSDIAIVANDQGGYDVIVTRGCEVFVVACTASPDPKEVRARVLELYLQTQEICANALVVSLVESPQNIKKIDGVKVVGKPHFQAIKDFMRVWFSG